MNAQEIVNKETGKVVFYACGKCGNMFPTNAAADQCCVPYRCDTCGCETKRYRTRCESCGDLAMLLKATVTPIEEFTMIQSDDYPYNDGYLDADDIHELEELDNPPAFVFGTTFTLYSLDAVTIVEQAMGDHHEDAEFDHQEELFAFVDDFNAKQRGGSYYQDEKRVVVLDQTRFDALIAKAREQEAARNAKGGAS